MEKLTPKDLWPNPVYEKTREEVRARIIRVKAPRRIAIGDSVTLLFENRETLRYQIQEMLRAESIDSPAGIQEQLDVYNGLLPSDGELSATLMIDVTDEKRIAETLRRLIGLDERLFLRFGAHELRAVFEGGRSDGKRISAVQFIRFQLDPDSRQAFLSAPAVRLELRHPDYQAAVDLGPESLASLRADLQY